MTWRKGITVDATDIGLTRQQHAETNFTHDNKQYRTCGFAPLASRETGAESDHIT
jgi:hypothetical protein